MVWIDDLADSLSYMAASADIGTMEVQSYHISAVIRQRLFSFQNNAKNLDVL